MFQLIAQGAAAERLLIRSPYRSTSLQVSVHTEMKLFGRPEHVIGVSILTLSTIFPDTFLLHQIFNLIQSNWFESDLSR